MSNDPNMIKTSLSLVAALAFAASSACAGGTACCATQSGKMECSQIYAKLNLTPEQKSKLDAFQARCMKDGCTKGSMKTFLHSAEGVLSPEQYAQLESACTRMEQKPAKAGS